MSLIEDALGRAEKEKADEFPQARFPEKAFEITENFHAGSFSRSKQVLLIISLLCIVGSAAWLYFWWSQRGTSLTGAIQLHADRRDAAKKLPEVAGLPPDSGQPLSAAKQVQEPSKLKTTALQRKAPAPPVKKCVVTAEKAALTVSPPVKMPVKNKKTISSSVKHKTFSGQPAKHRHSVRTIRHKNKHNGHAHTVRTAGIKHRSSEKTRSHKAARESLALTLAGKAIKEARQAYQQGSYRKAAEALEKSVTYAEPTPEILGFLGNAYFKAGEYDKASQALSNALHGDPENPKYLESLGMTMMAKGSPVQAIPLFLKALHSAPFKYTVRVNLGIAYWKTGALAAAEKQFKNAIVLEKSRPEAYFNMSGVYEVSGKFREAIQTLRTFLANANAISMAKEISVARKHLKFLEGYMRGKGKE